MIKDIIALLALFRPKMPDPETNAWVLETAMDESKWRLAHDVFDNVRRRRHRNLKAIKAEDNL